MPSLPGPGRAVQPRPPRHRAKSATTSGNKPNTAKAGVLSAACPPGAAGAVVAHALAPDQIAGAAAVHGDAEVVAVREPETGPALVRRAGSTAGHPGGRAPRGTAVRGCPVPDVPRRGTVAVVLPGDPEVTRPQPGRHLGEVGADLGPARTQSARRGPGPAAIGRGDLAQPHRRLRRGVRDVDDHD